MQKKVEKKLVSLCTGELFAAVLFAAMWVMYIGIMEWTKPYLTSFPPLYAFGLLELILLQGSMYWFLKLRQIRHKSRTRLPEGQRQMFQWFKRIDQCLIGVGVLILIKQLFDFPATFYWFLFLYVFALIEYINYFHIRLSYQTKEEIKDFLRQKEFRRSKLADELKYFN